MNDLDPIATTNKKSFDLLEIAVAATFKSAMYGTAFSLLNLIRMRLNRMQIIVVYEGSNF
jgi:hypothetical protein